MHVLGHDLMQMSDQELTEWRRGQIGLVFQSFGCCLRFPLMKTSSCSALSKGMNTMRAQTFPGMPGDRGPEPLARPSPLRDVRRAAAACGDRACPGESRQLILADEPTGELDSKTTRELLTFFRELVEQQHITMLMVSHDSLVDQYVHQVLTLKDGVIEHHRAERSDER